jgi:tetratricopeptide (TPR) repeat protein
MRLVMYPLATLYPLTHACSIAIPLVKKIAVSSPEIPIFVGKECMMSENALNKVMSLISRRAYSRALSMLDKLIMLHPNVAKYKVIKARIFQAKMDYVSAAAVYKDAIVASPYNHILYYELGSIYYRNCMYPNVALPVLLHGLGIEPGHVPTRVEVISAQIDLAMYDAALKVAEIGMLIAADDPDMLFATSRLHIHSGRYNEALRILSDAVLKHPQDHTLSTLHRVAERAVEEAFAIDTVSMHK